VRKLSRQEHIRQHEAGLLSCTPGAQLFDVLISPAGGPWRLADAKILDNGVEFLFCEVQSGRLDCAMCGGGAL
jgi:hypothetical protein